jgi:hypothetical protein
MGRRSKAELLNLVERIVDMHDRDKLTFEQIAEALQGEQIDVSRESARRAYANAEAKAAKYKLAAENAKAIIEASKGTNTDLAEAANSVLTNLFYEKVMSIDDVEFDSDAQMLKAMAPVMHNQVELAQARLNYQNGVEKCKSAILEELAKQLPDNPALLDALKGIVAAIKVKEK